MGCLLVYPLGFPPVLVEVFLSVIREKASRHKGKSEPKVGIKIEMWEPFPYFHRECREIIHQHGGFLSVYCKKSVAGIPPELPCFGTGKPCLFRPLRQDAGWPCGIAPDGLRSVLPGLSEKEIPEHKKSGTEGLEVLSRRGDGQSLYSYSTVSPMSHFFTLST